MAAAVKYLPFKVFLQFLLLLFLLPLSVTGCSPAQEFQETAAQAGSEDNLGDSNAQSSKITQPQLPGGNGAAGDTGAMTQGEETPGEAGDSRTVRAEVEQAPHGTKNSPPKEGPFPPNELGEIMILMYHEIGWPEGEWRRTPENFRRDLQTLYDGDYRLVHLDDVVRGEVNIARGTTPVVLTFDDGNRGNFRYLEKDVEKELDPDCAVAILETFNAKHPDFGVAATFYINYPDPFRQPEYTAEKLNYLVENGFAIGNHTYGHADLTRLGPGEIQRELALHQQATEQYVPGYHINSLALPYGAYPRQHAGLLLEGSFNGTSYRNLAVLLVGAHPAKSPFHRDFNPARLPRIRASELNTAGVGLYEWLAVFANEPQRRYVSDGNPRTITVPPSLLASLARERASNLEVYIYFDGN